MVRLSALCTGRLYPQEIFLILISVKRLSQPQGHSAAGWFMSMKNSNDTIGNRTRDLPACSAVPQPAAPPRCLTKEVLFSLPPFCYYFVCAFDLQCLATTFYYKMNCLCVTKICNTATVRDWNLLAMCWKVKVKVKLSICTP
jgi:hypothetical protein